MKTIDAKGLACPAPVLQTKAAMDEGGAESLTVIVDNAASMENVKRFLESNAYAVSIEEKEGNFHITGNLGAGMPPQSADKEADQKDADRSQTQKIAVFCSTDRMGFGDDELGKKLMISFIKTLDEMGPELWRIMLVNNGVKLAVRGSEVLEALQAYEKSGLKILVCGTCLTHFNLLDEKQVGETTNMLDIVTAMQLADKVISL